MPRSSQRYRLSPTRAAQAGAPDAQAPRPNRCTLRLAYRPPYDVAGVLRFLAQRALPGVEAVDGLELRRTLRWLHQGQSLAGWLAAPLRAARHEVQLSVAPDAAAGAGRRAAAAAPGAGPGRRPGADRPGAWPRCRCRRRAGLRVPGAMDGFETAARIILGQQVTVAAARTLTRRLVAELGQPLDTPFADLDRLFPERRRLAAADPRRIGRLGIVRQRVARCRRWPARWPRGASRCTRARRWPPRWTRCARCPASASGRVQLIAMRALAWPDAFAGHRHRRAQRAAARATWPQVQAQAEAWRPWRAYAVMRLWQTLENKT